MFPQVAHYVSTECEDIPLGVRTVIYLVGTYSPQVGTEIQVKKGHKKGTDKKDWAVEGI